MDWIKVFFLIFLILGTRGQGSKVEYVRLPLLTLEEQPPRQTTLKSFERTTLPQISIYTELTSRSPLSEEEEDEESVGERPTESPQFSVSSVIDKLTSLVQGDDDELDSGSLEGDDEEEKVEGREDTFGELDLIELVQELERQADVEEQTGIFPEILDIIHGKESNSSIEITTTTMSTEARTILPRKNDTWISLNANGDLEIGSEDLFEYSDEIVDGISAGIEESLRMSDDLEIDDFASNATSEQRQFSVYLFQGQYYAEPRLNRFIDGAIRNMGTEVRVSSMDPLYFRVLPRGQLAERDRPLMAASGARIRRPVAVGGRDDPLIATGRQLKMPAFFKPNQQKNKQQQNRQQLGKRPGNRKVVNAQHATRIANLGKTGIFLRRRRNRQRIQRQRRRRQRIRQQKIKQQRLKRKKQQQLNQKRKQQQLLNRIRRRTRQDVGGGRVEGLSRVQRDGDAEMQLFGNYTLIRSHMKVGPLEITMQFRTKNGIRRSGASLPVLRAHTVTRVNHEGSEMIDYLLDRPTPEMINVRGTHIFPMAQRVARNIFSRLFLPNSFLVSKLREKAALAFLSRPVTKRK